MYNFYYYHILIISEGWVLGPSSDGGETFETIFLPVPKLSAQKA